MSGKNVPSSLGSPMTPGLPPLLALAFLVCLGIPPLFAQADPANAAQAARVEVSLNLRGPAYAPLHGEVTLHAKDGSASRVLPLDGLGVLASLPPNSAWEISVSLPGYWCRRETLQLGPGGSAVTQPIDTWPLGTISGSLPELAVSPKEIEVEARPPRSAALRQERAPKGAFTCPVAADRTWTCTGVPATIFDLTVLVPRFAPEYRLAVHVLPGQNLDLGPLALRQGASVAGWVQIAPGGELAPECFVKLSPTEVTDTTPPLTVNVQEEGFFQLAGVSPGSYLLEVIQPGYHSPKVPVTVSPDSATYVKSALVLHRSP